MGDFALALLATSFYKIALILAGSVSTYLGYRLFIHGFTGANGNIETKVKDYSLIMTSIAPGTFFALFGTVLIGITAYRGMEVQLPQASITTTQSDPAEGSRPSILGFNNSPNIHVYNFDKQATLQAY